MVERYGDPDLAAMVGLTGGDQIAPEQAAWWLHRPSPTASLREQISWAIASVDLVEGADEARETLPVDYDGPTARADAVLSKVVLPLLRARDARIEELSRDLRDTHQRLIGERRLTAAYSARLGRPVEYLEPVRVDRPCDQPPVDPDSLAGRISFALDNKECTHPERIDCVDCMVAAVLSVVSPLLAAKDAENERANSNVGEYCRLYQATSDELAASRSAQKTADQGGEA